MSVSEEAKTRILNTLTKRIERDFDVTVVDTELGSFSPDGGNEYNCKLSLRGTIPDTDEFQETVSNYEYAYNGTAYWTRARYQHSDSLSTEGLREPEAENVIEYHVNIATD